MAFNKFFTLTVHRLARFHRLNLRLPSGAALGSARPACEDGGTGCFFRCSDYVGVAQHESERDAQKDFRREPRRAASTRLEEGERHTGDEG